MEETQGRFAGYTVERELACGGFGTVYLARDAKGRQVAIKQLSRHQFDRDIAGRFLREAMRVEELRERFRLDFLVPIVQVLPEIPAYVMEYIPESASAYYVRQADERFLFDIVSAIAQLHRIGVAHRDIKPANIRVGAGRPVLIDFGVSSWWDSRSQVIPVGTRFYSPPEMVAQFDEFHGCAAATRASRKLTDIEPDSLLARLRHVKMIHDVYSLGITLGELMLGRLPFDLEAYRSYLDNGTSPGYEAWIQEIPPTFRLFVVSATTFSPESRPLLPDLISTLPAHFATSTAPIQHDLPPAALPEIPLSCWSCGHENPGASASCPTCGETGHHQVLSIHPRQPVRLRDAPAAVRLLSAGPGGLPAIDIDEELPDFDLVLGRDPATAHIAFPDDNWMSKGHGRLRKDGGRLLYADGLAGRAPTSPARMNGIPTGPRLQEIPPGSFLTLGSTVLGFHRGFGRYRPADDARGEREVP